MRLISPILLHHGGPQAQGGIQGFIDSELGNTVAIIAHTIGAILFAIGIGVILLWARAARATDRDRAKDLAHFLPSARLAVIVGVVVNFAGGIMRLYQSDHPSLTEIGTNPWVQLLVLKHVVLVAGVFLSFYLSYGPLRAYAPSRWGGRTPLPSPHLAKRTTLIASWTILAIAAAAILGAVANTVGPGTLPADVMGDGMGPAVEGGGVDGRILYANYTGTITGTPLSPGEDSLAFDVFAGTNEILAEIAWSDPVAAFGLVLVDPDGNEAATFRETGSRQGEARAATDIAPGQWTATITSERGLNTRFNLTVRMLVGVRLPTEVVDTVTIPPNLFAELNMNMTRGAVFNYTFEADADVYFNIHSHPNDELVIHEEGTYRTHAGTFAADRDDVFSILFENRGLAPITVRYGVEGRFEVHSFSGVGS
ncbi:MAG: hypothetical protein ACT4PT_11115 [Methanobacteriota archaeon]